MQLVEHSEEHAVGPVLQRVEVVELQAFERNALFQLGKATLHPGLAASEKVVAGTCDDYSADDLISLRQSRMNLDDKVKQHRKGMHQRLPG